jgi:hypothetical protein
MTTIGENLRRSLHPYRNLINTYGTKAFLKEMYKKSERRSFQNNFPLRMTAVDVIK